MLYLACFDFLLHHKPDTLSQRADHGTDTEDNSNITLLAPKLFAAHALEGLEFTRPELDILHDIRKGVKNTEEEPIAKAIEELWKSST